MEINDHKINTIPWIASPNAADRPLGVLPELLVIHCISLPPKQYGGDAIIQLFTNHLDTKTHPYYKKLSEIKVSAHVLVRRDGSAIQFVAFNRCAWHAGVASYKGRQNCNEFSIGIELEGHIEDPFETQQYDTLTEIAYALIANYPKMSQERIVGHSDIASERKKDPGPLFDMNRLKQKIKQTKK